MKTKINIPAVLWKIYVAVAFFVTCILFYPLITLFLWTPKMRKMSFLFFVAWSFVLRILCLYFYSRKGNIPQSNHPCIYVANHFSYLDIFLLPSLLPSHPFLFLGKSELLYYPMIRTYFKTLHIPVFRDDKRKAAQSFIRAKKALKEGWSLVIFPEGGIHDHTIPELAPFKEGAFKLAMQANVPIVPITFVNHHLLFSDPGNWAGRGKPGISKTIIHEAIQPSEYKIMSVAELSDKVAKIIDKEIDKRK